MWFAPKFHVFKGVKSFAEIYNSFFAGEKSNWFNYSLK